MTSVAKAETGDISLNWQVTISLYQTLEEHGHPQPPSSIQVDTKCVAIV